MIYVFFSQSTLPNFKQNEFSVVRQHEEFIWLHDSFVENEEYAGYIVSIFKCFAYSKICLISDVIDRPSCQSQSQACNCFICLSTGRLFELSASYSLLYSTTSLCVFESKRPSCSCQAWNQCSSFYSPGVNKRICCRMSNVILL